MNMQLHTIQILQHQANSLNNWDSSPLILH
jgi:hypothetical protein